IFQRQDAVTDVGSSSVMTVVRSDMGGDPAGPVAPVPVELGRLVESTAPLELLAVIHAHPFEVVSGADVEAHGVFQDDVDQRVESGTENLGVSLVRFFADSDARGTHPDMLPLPERFDRAERREPRLLALDVHVAVEPELEEIFGGDDE